MIIVYDEAGNIILARDGDQAPPLTRPGLRSMIVDGRPSQVANMRVDVFSGRLVPISEDVARQRQAQVEKAWRLMRDLERGAVP